MSEQSKDWECPKCGALLRDTGVRLVHKSVNFWEECFGIGSTSWFVDGDDHGDAESFDLCCLKCENDLPIELAEQVHQDMEDNWD